MSQCQCEEGVPIRQLYHDDVDPSLQIIEDEMWCPVCDERTTKLLDLADEVDDGTPLCPRCFGNWLAAEGAKVVLPEQ
jgi:hypothetical protein